MDNKELPQEIMNEIALADCQKQVSVKYGLGTTLVTGHKAAYFNEATEMLLSQKDTTIKELQVENEKLTGLLESKCKEYLAECWQGAETAIVGETRKVVTLQEAKETYWQSYKEQHGI